MNYIFDIFLTEEDYIDFNVFHLSRSVYGKKHQRVLQILLAVIFAAAALINFWAEPSISASAFTINANLLFTFVNTIVMWLTVFMIYT